MSFAIDGGLEQPDHYAVDRASATNKTGDRVECVVVVLCVRGVERRYVLTKEDAIVLGLALQEAAHDAKRLIDVSRGVTG